jgi:hypothetical protein
LFALVAGLALAGPISELLFGTGEHADLVRAAFVGLWAHVNYEQMTALFRVEQRSVAYLIATLINLGLTVAATVLLVVVWEQGPIGVIVGGGEDLQGGGAGAPARRGAPPPRPGGRAPGGPPRPARAGRRAPPPRRRTRSGPTRGPIPDTAWQLLHPNRAKSNLPSSASGDRVMPSGTGGGSSCGHPVHGDGDGMV